MTRRLITLRQIRDEKYPRSRSQIYKEMIEGKFPRPLDTGTGGPNLWDEADVDKAIDDLVASAKARAKTRESNGAKRTVAATSAQAKQREHSKQITA